MPRTQTPYLIHALAVLSLAMIAGGLILEHRDRVARAASHPATPAPGIVLSEARTPIPSPPRAFSKNATKVFGTKLRRASGPDGKFMSAVEMIRQFGPAVKESEAGTCSARADGFECPCEEHEDCSNSPSAKSDAEYAAGLSR